MSDAKERPDTPRPQATLCPYCGHVSGSPSRCRVCGGRFDPLSRQATQNTMGPWYVRNETSPHLPGCSYETVRKLASRGKITRATILRGPTTRQFWVIANRVPGVAHLLGECHNCHAPASPSATDCDRCGVSFLPELDRQQLGLAPVHLLPGQATPEQIAAQSTALEQAAQASTAPPADVDDVTAMESPATSAIIDEIVDDAPVPRRRRPMGKVALGVALLGACGALGWFGYERAMLVLDSPDAPVVLEPESQAPTSTEIASIEAPEPDPSPPLAVDPERTVIGLLRDGRVEAAREALEQMGIDAGPEFEAVERRAERDRIRSFLTG